MHVDDDGRKSAAEDGRGACDGRLHAGNLSQLAAKVVLNCGQRPRAAMSERHIDAPLIRSAAKSAADRAVGEVRLRLTLQECGNLAAAGKRVLEARARRNAERHGELITVDARN